MITGLRLPARRTVAARPAPTPTLMAQNTAALRAAVGPGYQAGLSESVVRQAVRR